MLRISIGHFFKSTLHSIKIEKVTVPLLSLRIYSIYNKYIYKSTKVETECSVAFTIHI